MSHKANKLRWTVRDFQKSSMYRVCFLIGAALFTSLSLLAGCGQTATGSPVATPSLTPVSLPTVEPTATTAPTATATPTRAPTSSTCQPDDYGIYADQTGFSTNLTDAPLPAPPKTKHGLGSAGANAGVIQGGESGVCTIGTFASVTTFYSQRLPSLGWQYSAPPTALDVCFHGSVPAQAWWKGSNTFSWYDGGNAGGGSIFWSYTYCSVQN